MAENQNWANKLTRRDTPENVWPHAMHDRWVPEKTPNGCNLQTYGTSKGDKEQSLDQFRIEWSCRNAIQNLQRKLIPANRRCNVCHHPGK